MDQENNIPSKGGMSHESYKIENDFQNRFLQICRLISNEAESAIVGNSTTINKDMISLAADNSHETVTGVSSDAYTDQLNYDSFVSPMEGLDASTETNTDEFLTVKRKIVNGKTNAFELPLEHSMNDYTCQCCGYACSKRHILARHMKCHSDERPYKCELCGRGFKTVTTLQSHVNTHTKTRPYSCQKCNSTFTTSGDLGRHMRYKHTHERPHRCPECDYASVELSKLKRHMRCHTGERPCTYQCPHCAYTGPDTYKLKCHLRTHTGEKPYACDICHARFTQSNSLKVHLLIHSGNKPAFQCAYCPSTCGRKIDLRVHIQKMHTSDKVLTCKRCGKVFKDRYRYKVHCKTHNGNRCFECTHCPFMTISHQQFEAHVVTHGNEGLHQCTICCEDFSHKQLLIQHINFCHESDCVTVSKMKDTDPTISPGKRDETVQIGEPSETGQEESSSQENFKNNQDLLKLTDKHELSDDENKVPLMANFCF